MKEKVLSLLCVQIACSRNGDLPPKCTNIPSTITLRVGGGVASGNVCVITSRGSRKPSGTKDARQGRPVSEKGGAGTVRSDSDTRRGTVRGRRHRELSHPETGGLLDLHVWRLEGTLG